jgi:formamidopyrimidine-DNA glycosylase
MPELPEVEWVARTLRPRLVGRRVLEVESSGLPLRRPIDLGRLRRALRGATVDAVERLGKYLLIQTSSAHTLVAHLGMSGRFVFAPPAAARAPHTHAVFRLDGELELRYVDHRRFGVLAVYAAARARRSPELAGLGLDPLDAAFTVEHLRAQLAATRREIKTFLLDQTRLAGLGNIYAAEALFRAGIAPRRRADRLPGAAAERLHAAIRAVLRDGITHRGTSFSDYVDAEGVPGDNQARLDVYGRDGQPCRRCGRPIRRLVQGARSTFYCPTCQK